MSTAERTKTKAVKDEQAWWETLGTKEDEKIDSRQLKILQMFWNLTNVKQSDEKLSLNDNDEILIPLSKLRSKIQNPSLKEKGDEQISPLSKVNKQKPAGTNTGEDRVLPQYSTGEQKMPPREIDDFRITSQRNKEEDLIQPGNKKDE